MSRKSIFLSILIGAGIPMFFGVSNNAISLGMIVGGAISLFGHWFWNREALQ